MGKQQKWDKIQPIFLDSQDRKKYETQLLETEAFGCEEKFEKIYNSDDIKTETNNITVTLKRKDRTWNLSGDKDEITNALLPGYSDISSELNNISE